MMSRLTWRHRVAASMIPAGSSILDIGCGDGILIRILQEKGCRCLGIELDQGKLTEGEKKGLPVVIMDLDSETPAGQFDYVCALEVLEHLHDPVRVLKALREVANKGIFSCCNHFWWRYRLAHLVGNTYGLGEGGHLWHWNFTRFREVLVSSGWRPLRTEILVGTPILGHFSRRLAYELALRFPNLFVFGNMFLCSTEPE